MPRVRHFLAGFAAVLVATAAFTADLAAQETTGTIRGRVSDAAQLTPIPDATISVAGQTVLSTQEGFYVVERVPAGIHMLRANVLGYRPFETEVTVTAGQTTTVNVNMPVAPLEMTPLVAVGYGELERSENVGVVTEVPAEAFNTGRIVTSEELIKGKVAGVQVTENNGGEPGGGTSIRIRGGTSITSSNEPLYVIDGVPIEVGGGIGSVGGLRSPLAFLNPDDIASMTVLKDASATAIYGSRGANGVILIETTAGRAAAGAPTKVTYRGNFSGSTIDNSPNVLNAAQFRDAVAAQAPEVLGVLGDESTDWYDAMTDTGFGQEHTLGVSGGGEKMDFRVSLGYFDQEGVVNLTDMQRASLNFGYNQLLFDDRLSLAANVLGARTERNSAGSRVLGSATNFAPTQPIYDSLSVYGGYFEWDDILGTNNPVGEANLVTQQEVAYRSIGNVTAEYFLPKLDGLSVTGRFGYTFVNGEGQFFAPSYAKFQTEAGQLGTIWRSTGTESSWLGDAFLTYAGNWDNHQLTATGGYSYQQWQTDNPYFEAQQLSSDLLGPDGVPSYDFNRITLNVEEHKLGSWFARANYTLLDRYTLTASFRADESSRFGEENKWGYFPSFGAAWQIGGESWADSDFLSDLRLRASWGKNGNEAFANYQQYKTYVYSENTAQAQFGDEFVPTIRPSAVDPNIKWEETSSWNIGLDYGFNQNRWWGSLEYYDKTTEDLIFDVIVAGGTNLSNVVTTNVGEMRNRGFEVTLNGVFVEPRDPGDFTWDAMFNAAYNDNELTKINQFGTGTERILAGDAISGGVGSFIQVLSRAGRQLVLRLRAHLENGEPIYRDVNGDGSINEQDLYVDQNGDGFINQDDRGRTRAPSRTGSWAHVADALEPVRPQPHAAGEHRELRLQQRGLEHRILRSAA